MVNKRTLIAIQHRTFRLHLTNIWHTHSGKPVRCLETNIVYETAAEAERQLKIARTLIGLCCQGKNLTAGNYHWQYADSAKTIVEIEQTRDQSKKKAIICLETGIQYNSAQEAYKQTGISFKNISSCCLNNRRIAGGYHWQFLKDIATNDYQSIIYQTDLKYNTNNRKTVYQYNLQSGELLKEWLSAAEAKRALKQPGLHINDCCNGKRTQAGGYYWSYIKADNYKDIKND